jgi:chloramphenicol-sensitive protein RarD
VLFLPAVGLLVALSSRSGSAVDIASNTEWAFLLGTGLITAVPLMLFASAAQSIPFTLLGPLNLLVPVINFGLGWAIYDEPMPLNRLIGFAFVWMALIVVMADRVREAHRRNRVAAAPVAAQ